MTETASTTALIPRIHLFELLDQDWYPRTLRELGTDYLYTVSEKTGAYDAATDILARGLRASETPELLDLGSGGTGPLPRLCRLLKSKHGLEPHVVLSDLYPTVQGAQRAREHGVDYLERPVDATRVPPDLRGMRTLFSAMHHLRPEQVRQVLADAQERNVPFAAFEVMRRTPAGVLGMLPVPLMVWLFTPFIRPLTPLRLLLTYVVPVAPLASLWDGLVSALRAHRPEELRAMTASLAREGYTWEVGELRKPGRPTVTYVLGLPDRTTR
ncbi:hypothetical protein F0U60_50790 [Archangium minus]|uniref:Class I SAM-dependent methyltransferase n=1 Tax=Archangium minus TaxID=83450 RepID=A0ABY9X7Y6_9BACT|nr:hypothetical protein F0U60_50790 [Archangium minus]